MILYRWECPTKHWFYEAVDIGFGAPQGPAYCPHVGSGGLVCYEKTLLTVKHFPDDETE